MLHAGIVGVGGGVVVVSCHLQNAVGDEIFAGAVALHDCAHHVLRNVIVISQKLFGVFRQTVTAVSEGRVVVMRADSRVETYAVDDVACA